LLKVCSNKKELRFLFRNSLIFKVGPTGLEPVTPWLWGKFCWFLCRRK